MISGSNPAQTNPAQTNPAQTNPAQTNPAQTNPILQTLSQESAPFTLPRRSPQPLWADRDRHEQYYNQDPSRYSLLALAPGTTEQQRLRILFQILRASRRGMALEQRQLLDRITTILLAVLPGPAVLTVCLALRRERVNHRHSRRAICHYFLNSPQGQSLLQSRPRAVREVLEHAVGRNSLRGWVQSFADGLADFFPSSIAAPRDLPNSSQAQDLLLELYGYEPASSLPLTPETPASTLAHFLSPQIDRESTVTVASRGEIAATLVNLYQSGSSAALWSHLEIATAIAANPLPIFDGNVAIILDASASMQGYGQREFAVLSQAVALQRVLQRFCPQAQVHWVGGSAIAASSETPFAIPLPMAQGATDLAMALVDTLEPQPDLVVIIADGYENQAEGDLGRVVATLPQMGITTPIALCTMQFTDRDSLTWRRPLTANLPSNASPSSSPASSSPANPAVATFTLWHQQEFPEMLLRLMALVQQPEAEAWMTQYLLGRLDQAEALQTASP
jgi:hypothetical protein